MSGSTSLQCPRCSRLAGSPITRQALDLYRNRDNVTVQAGIWTQNGPAGRRQQTAIAFCQTCGHTWPSRHREALRRAQQGTQP